MGNLTAQLIATLIQSNCDAHLSGATSRAAWEAEQVRLWKLAERKGCAHAVKMLVAPKALPVPPYAVRKQLREQTLKVGR